MLTGDMSPQRLFGNLQEGEIIESYRTDLLKKAKIVFDFLYDIKKGNKVDEAILDNWASFFIGKKVPFVIVESMGRKKLWKERYHVPGHENFSTGGSS